MKRAWPGLMLVAVLGASCAVHAVTLLRLNAAESRLEAVLDAADTQSLVDERMGYYAETMRDGASLDTTSTEATFWWVGYSASKAYEEQARFSHAFENSLHANGMLSEQFHEVHQVIDQREWPVGTTPEPYLTYDGD